MYIFIYLFKEDKLINIKSKGTSMSREKVKFTKLFQFIRPTTCRYKYICTTYPLPHILAAGNHHQEAAPHSKLSEL